MWIKPFQCFPFSFSPMNHKMSYNVCSTHKIKRETHRTYMYDWEIEWVHVQNEYWKQNAFKLLVVIVQVRIVFRKTVVGDWCFNYLSGSHLQSQVTLTLDSEDDFRSGSRNVSHQQQSSWRLLSPGRSQPTNCSDSWVQTICQNTFKVLDNKEYFGQWASVRSLLIRNMTWYDCVGNII